LVLQLVQVFNEQITPMRPLANLRSNLGAGCIIRLAPFELAASTQLGADFI
jgi:hypothetical protein